MRTIHFYVLSSICMILTKKLIRKYIVFYCCNEKEVNVNVKTNNSNEKKKKIIVITRILKVLAIILLITMLVTKMILKTSIVKIRNSVVTMTLQIRRILI